MIHNVRLVLHIEILLFISGCTERLHWEVLIERIHQVFLLKFLLAVWVITILSKRLYWLFNIRPTKIIGQGTEIHDVWFMISDSGCLFTHPPLREEKGLLICKFGKYKPGVLFSLLPPLGMGCLQSCSSLGKLHSIPGVLMAKSA